MLLTEYSIFIILLTAFSILTADYRVKTLEDTKVLATSDKDVLWEVQACRGREGHCPYALSSLSRLKGSISEELRVSSWSTFAHEHWPGRSLPHHQLRVALAACPNACTRPQIQDIGVIAVLRPDYIQENCTGCRRCERACREDAISVKDGLAQISAKACLACGECMTACPIDAIKAEPLYYRIMVGGRLGRHPRWASELHGKLSKQEVPKVIARFIKLISDEVHPMESVSALVERLGPDHIWEVIGMDRHE